MTEEHGKAQIGGQGRSVGDDAPAAGHGPAEVSNAAKSERPGPRNIVICLDGTNDQIGVSRPTNPAKVFEMLDLDEQLRQIAYYDPGVGTLPASTARGKIGQWVSRRGEQAFGFGMKTNLMQSYTWLMERYQPGDKIYVFGFSRGAFTARALVGMLARPGLLRSGSLNLVEYAVKEYAQKRMVNDQDVEAFADALCWGTRSHPMNPGRLPDDKDRVHAIPVEYLGIWDTVEASGFAGIGKGRWPGTKRLRNVKKIRHAVSIDERRRPFHEFLVKSQDFEEVWFAGVHCDVGGTFKECKLATIALKWVFDGICHELRLRDGNPAASYAKWCTVSAEFATAAIHKNNWVWKLIGSRTRPIPDGAFLHETVRLRQERQPTYLPNLENAQWANTDWSAPLIRPAQSSPR